MDDFTALRGVLDHHHDGTRTMQTQIGEIQYVIEQTEQAILPLSESFRNILAHIKDRTEESRAFIDYFVGSPTGDPVFPFNCFSELLHLNSAQVSQMMACVENMTKTNAVLMAQVQKLSQDVAGIQDIAKEVSYVASQTKLLALNATIEASRAGESGRGFAVVATEVRNLSTKAMHAGESITELSASIRQHVDSTIQQAEMVMSQNQEESEEALQRLEGFSGKFNATLHAVADALGDITESSESMSENISNVLFSFQFQDIVRQRLEFVMKALDDLQNEMVDDATVLQTVVPELQDWQPNPEKEVPVRTTVTTENHYDVNDGDNVEFF